MMDWYGNRYNETYTYVLVSPIDWSEQGTYDYITSGTLELSTDNKYKVSGSFQFNGPEAPDPNYYLRVYYSFDSYNDELEDMEHEDVILATLLVSFSSMQYKEYVGGMLYSGTLTGASVLKILDDKKYGEPFIIKKNSNAIYKAFELIEDFGLRVNYTPSSATLNVDHTFSGDNSYLDLITWLCDYAGFGSPNVDAEGVIQLKSILKPEQDPEPIEFRNDEQSIMYPEVDENNDWQQRANVVKVIYNTDKAWGIASSSNVSGSRMSLDALNGREITLVEEASDFDSSKNLLNQLIDRSEELLREQANETETVTFSHAYVPIELTKAVKIEYSDMSWLGAVENVSINLSPATKTQTKIQKTIEHDITVSKKGTFKPRNGDSQTYNGGY